MFYRAILFCQCNSLAEKLQDELQLSVQELAKVNHEGVVFLWLLALFLPNFYVWEVLLCPELDLLCCQYLTLHSLVYQPT